MAHPPAVDQYAFQLPGARGQNSPDQTPVARPAQLPAQVRGELSGANGRLLAQVATARALGAPRVGAGSPAGRSGPGSGGPSQVAASGRALPTVVADALGSGPGLGLLAALAAIAALAGFALWRGRRGTGRG